MVRARDEHHRTPYSEVQTRGETFSSTSADFERLGGDHDARHRKSRKTGCRSPSDAVGVYERHRDAHTRSRVRVRRVAREVAVVEPVVVRQRRALGNRSVPRCLYWSVASGHRTTARRLALGTRAADTGGRPRRAGPQSYSNTIRRRATGAQRERTSRATRRSRCGETGDHGENGARPDPARRPDRSHL